MSELERKLLSLSICGNSVDAAALSQLLSV